MKKPFLDQPYRYTQAPRQRQRDADYGNPFGRPARRRTVGDVALAVAIGLAGAWFFVEWLSR